MKISQLIEKLNQAQQQFGDKTIVMSTYDGYFDNHIYAPIANDDTVRFNEKEDVLFIDEE